MDNPSVKVAHQSAGMTNSSTGCRLDLELDTASGRSASVSVSQCFSSTSRDSQFKSSLLVGVCKRTYLSHCLFGEDEIRAFCNVCSSQENICCPVILSLCQPIFDPLLSDPHIPTVSTSFLVLLMHHRCPVFVLPGLIRPNLVIFVVRELTAHRYPAGSELYGIRTLPHLHKALTSTQTSTFGFS